MNTETLVLQRLTEVFHDVFDDDSIVLRPDMTARDVEGWDSLTHVRLILTVEKRLGIRISSHEIAGLKSVGDLIRLSEAKLAASAAGSESGRKP